MNNIGLKLLWILRHRSKLLEKHRSRFSSSDTRISIENILHKQTRNKMGSCQELIYVFRYNNRIIYHNINEYDD